MQTINKQKPVAPDPRSGVARLYGARAGYFGITHREYFALGKFSNAADGLGLKTTGIGRGPFGVGCLLQLSSSNHHYEVLVNAGHLLLGRVEKDGKRVRLAEGADTEASWAMLLETVEREEKR
jgi:hypothetical protein